MQYSTQQPMQQQPMMTQQQPMMTQQQPMMMQQQPIMMQQQPMMMQQQPMMMQQQPMMMQQQPMMMQQQPMMMQQQPMMTQQQPMMTQQQPMMTQQQPMMMQQQPMMMQPMMVQQPMVLQPTVIGTPLQTTPINHPIKSPNIVMERGMVLVSRRGGYRPYIARVNHCGCRYYVYDDAGCCQGCCMVVCTVAFFVCLILGCLYISYASQYDTTATCTLEDYSSSSCTYTECHSTGHGCTSTTYTGAEYTYTFSISCSSSEITESGSCEADSGPSYSVGSDYTCYANSGCTTFTWTSPSANAAYASICILIGVLIALPMTIYCTRIYLFVFHPYTYKKYCCYREQ